MPSFAREIALGLEIMALRQQVSVLKRKNRRPRLRRWDQLFWVFLRRLWSRWTEVLVVVKPEPVVRWHRAGFRKNPTRPYIPTWMRTSLGCSGRPMCQTPKWARRPTINHSLL